jgi:hypothetical protein
VEQPRFWISKFKAETKISTTPTSLDLGFVDILVRGSAQVHRTQSTHARTHKHAHTSAHSILSQACERKTKLGRPSHCRGIDTNGIRATGAHFTQTATKNQNYQIRKKYIPASSQINRIPRFASEGSRYGEEKERSSSKYGENQSTLDWLNTKEKSAHKPHAFFECVWDSVDLTLEVNISTLILDARSLPFYHVFKASLSVGWQ